jgi:hypothetical protein
MPDHDLPDVLVQLERYGTVLERAGGDGDGDVGAPTVDPVQPPSTALGRATLVAAVAVFLLLGVLALNRDGDATTTGPASGGSRPVDPVTVEPSAPPTSPRLVAGRLPAGLVPDAAIEGRSSPGIEEAPVPLASDGSLATVQAFQVADGPGPALTVTVVIAGTDDGPQTPFIGMPPVRGVGGGETNGTLFRSLDWGPAGARITAQVPNALPMTDLRAIVEALRVRGDEPLGGFDPPETPVGRWTITLRAEHVVARHTPPRPVSQVWYHDPANPDRAAVVQAFGPMEGASADLVTTSQGGEVRTIAGAPRVIAALPVVPWTTVTWVQPDGVQVAVQTRNLADADIETLVGGIVAADTATWDGVLAQIGTALRAEHVAAEADLPIGKVTIYGDANVYGGLRGACLAVTGRVPRCTAIPPERDGRGVTEVIGAGGKLTVRPLDSAQFVTSLLVEGRWYGIGTRHRVHELTITADGQPVEVGIARLADDVTVFGAELPAAATRAEVRGQIRYGSTGPGTIPGSGGSSPFDVTLVRP